MSLKLNYDTPAVVLGLFDTGLSVVRLLSRAGIQVTAVYADCEDVGTRTLCANVIQGPDPASESGALVDKLIEIAKNLSHKPVLYPASDIYVNFVSTNRKTLEEHYLFLLPGAEVTEKILNKKTQYELVEKAEILQPLSVFPDETVSGIQVLEKLTPPLFVKPLFNFPWQKYFDIKGYRVENLKELEKTLTSLRNHHLQFVVQEKIDGDDKRHYECSLFIDSTGTVRGKTMIQKLRQYPLNFGLATYIHTVNMPEVEKEAFKLVKKLGILGFANIEFKVDKRDEKLKYIETNIRVWQQIGLGAKSGMQFVLLYYGHLTGQKIPELSETKIGISWCDPITDFYSFCSQPRFRLFKIFKWLSQVRHCKDQSVVSLSDPCPTLKSFQYGLVIIKMIKFAFQKAFKF